MNSLKNPNTLLSAVLNLSLILLMFYPLFQPGSANATVTEGFVRFDRLSTGSAISGTACLKSTLATQTATTIVFPSGWTISSTASNWTISTSNLPTDPVGGTAATAWPGINTATSVNGLSVTFPTTAFTPGTFYCFNFAGASSTVGSAGANQTGTLKTQGGAPYTDYMDFATQVVTSNADQILVSASVSATMTFALSGNSVNLGTLSTSSVTSDPTGITQTVTTNARNGYTSWIKGTSTTGGTGGGLHSATAGSDIPSTGSFPTVTDLTSNTGVVIDGSVTGGTNPPTTAAGYSGNGTSSGGHFDGGIFHQTATLTSPTGSSTIKYTLRAKIAATQQAASDYSDTLIVTAAGSF